MLQTTIVNKHHTVNLAELFWLT